MKDIFDIRNVDYYERNIELMKKDSCLGYKHKSELQAITQELAIIRTHIQNNTDIEMNDETKTKADNFIYNYNILMERYKNSKGLTELLRNSNIAYFITITQSKNNDCHSNKSVAMFIKNINLLLKKVNQRFYCNRFRKKPDSHLKGFAIYENNSAKTHPHYHLLINDDPELNLPDLKKNFEEACREYNAYKNQILFNYEKGIDIQRVDGDERLYDYLTKQDIQGQNITFLNKYGISDISAYDGIIRVA
ncbi:hypothetical protein [Limisalsivibrio acetivorans]|uniref:hypothetical protein n=1 Tax=Limisalsivibrio acetivorans TaxID=1304888 RepID=UPI0003B46E91|nr:hypothetical protein [Limisalsivibrio acetivorans]